MVLYCTDKDFDCSFGPVQWSCSICQPMFHFFILVDVPSSCVQFDLSCQHKRTISWIRLLSYSDSVLQVKDVSEAPTKFWQYSWPGCWHSSLWHCLLDWRWWQSKLEWCSLFCWCSVPSWHQDLAHLCLGLTNRNREESDMLWNVDRLVTLLG